MNQMSHQEFMKRYKGMIFPESIGYCYDAYVSSTATDQLRELTGVLREIADNSLADQAFRVQSRALALCIEAKVWVLHYAEEEYAADVYREADQFFAASLQTLEGAGAANTVRRLTNLRAAIGRIHAIMEDALELVLQVRDENGQRATSSEDLMRSVLGRFEAKQQQCAELPDIALLFEEMGMVLPDPTACVREDIDEVVEWIRAELVHMRQYETQSFFDSFTSPLEQVPDIGSPTFFPPLHLSQQSSATTVVLSSPLWDEVLLFVGAYATHERRTFLVVDATGFADREPDFINAFFQTLSERGQDCLLTGLSSYTGPNAHVVYEATVRYSTTGRVAFVHDTKGDRGVYDGIYNYIKTKPDLNGLQVSYRFLLLPLLFDVMEELKERGIVTDADGVFVRESLAFMGYVGFNRIVWLYNQGRPWRDDAAELSDRHERDSTRYLTQLPSQEQFLDSSWRVVGSARDRKKPKKEFDYDTIRSASPANIKKILEADIPLFAKCGLISKYCTLHGDDISVWGTLDSEEMSRRLTDATCLVSHLLQTEYAPVVEVVPEEKWPSKRAGGFCCDGGKLIKYRETCCQNYAWLIDAICHECYHSFQSTLEHNGHMPWHWNELGVTAARVKQWAYNEAHYRSIEDVKITYELQVLEADARAFADDCISQSNACYASLELE